MTIIAEQLETDSPYLASVMYGQTVGAGSPIRPAETNWHLVFTKYDGVVHPIVVGPWSSSGVVKYGAGAEILWVQMKAGVYMPHLPAKNIRDTETELPRASCNRFWLHGDTWEIPDFENVDIFIGHLIRENVLDYDPLIAATLDGQNKDVVAPRTLRHRFLHITGNSQNHIQQVHRARQAATLLQQGTTILDVVYELGYYDQSHLTRSLKQFIGYTPGQLIQMYSGTGEDHLETEGNKA